MCHMSYDYALHTCVCVNYCYVAICGVVCMCWSMWLYFNYMRVCIGVLVLSKCLLIYYMAAVRAVD